jgi:hypothetical protein
MHLDRANNASKNNCKNANTLAHDDDHLVVLAPLRRRLSLSSRGGLGSSLPSAKLARQDSGVFKEMKHLFSIAPKNGKGGKVAEGFLAVF